MFNPIPSIQVRNNDQRRRVVDDHRRNCSNFSLIEKSMRNISCKMAEKSYPEVYPESNSSQIECAVCLQSCVHPTVLPCGHIFCYLCVKGLGRTTKLCAMCRREFPDAFIENPSLLRPIESALDAGFEDGQQWFYEGRNGGWWQYECRISEEIENAYKTNEKSVEIIICGELYVVDLNTMHQFQKNNPIRRRRIKRSRIVDTKAKGVAGLLKS